MSTRICSAYQLRLPQRLFSFKTLKNCNHFPNDNTHDLGHYVFIPLSHHVTGWNPGNRSATHLPLPLRVTPPPRPPHEAQNASEIIITMESLDSIFFVGFNCCSIGESDIQYERGGLDKCSNFRFSCVSAPFVILLVVRFLEVVLFYICQSYC